MCAQSMSIEISIALVTIALSTFENHKNLCLIHFNFDAKIFNALQLKENHLAIGGKLSHNLDEQ